MRNLFKRTLSYLCILALLAGFAPAAGTALLPSTYAASGNAASANAAADTSANATSADADADTSGSATSADASAVTSGSATSADASADASAEASADATAQVYVTIANAGEIVVGQDDAHTLMARVSIAVTDADNDGSLTFNDAMLITHEQYCPGGYEAAEGESGYVVNKLWNDTSYNFGYYVDGKSAYSAKELISDQSEITAFIYKDTAKYSDAYSFFLNASQNKINESVLFTETEYSLSLGYSTWSASGSVANATLGFLSVSGDAVAFTPLQDDSGNEIVTASDGTAKVTFDKPGTYVLSAQSETQTLVPPICTVRIVDTDYYKAYINAVEYLKAQASKDETAFANIKNVWNVINLFWTGDYNESLEKKYIENLTTYVKGQSGTVEAKYCLSLSVLGRDITDFAGYNLLDAFSDTSTIEAQGVTAVAYVIMALNAHADKISGSDSWVELAKTYAKYLAENALEDGGWSWGTAFDPDSTAMVLQALAPYYGEDEDITKEIDKAVALLSIAQLESGGLKSADSEWEGVTYPGTENSNTTAEVWLAMSALGKSIDDTSFVKNGKTIQDALLAFQLEDGSFAYDTTTKETNDMATYQSMQALFEYYQTLYGTTNQFDLSKQSPEYPQTPDPTPTPKEEEPATPSETPTTTEAPATTAAAATTEAPAVSQNETATAKPVLAKQVVKQVKALKKKIKVTLTKNKKASGYQIQYSTSKKFTKKTTHTITLKSAKKTSYTITKCKSKKTYYVRVRSYKKSGKKRIYGEYSKVRKVQVK